VTLPASELPPEPSVTDVDPGAGPTDEPADDPYARALGDRLRRVRIQQNRSLHDVEAGSRGELKASVVGAYERGERAVSITRLHALAAFYRVPVVELLPIGRRGEDDVATPEIELVIDLAALERERDQLPTLARYVESIQAKRGDYNGQVLTVRSADLETLAAVLDESPVDLRERLTAAGIVR
jgi:transcriptional regulator with XRE-family HTH domain